MTLTITINVRLVLSILTGILWFLGCCILCRNSDGEFKHNIIMGLLGGFLVGVLPIIFFGGVTEGWW